MRLFKLGCTWGTGAPSFYEYMKNEKIVLGDDSHVYEVGDIIAITNGFTVYALGIVTQDTYQDMERLIKLRETLNSDSQEFSFTSPETLGPIKKLHAIQKMGISQLEAPDPDKEADINFYNMHMARKEQVIRSAFALAIASICTELNKDNPLV